MVAVLCAVWAPARARPVIGSEGQPDPLSPAALSRLMDRLGGGSARGSVLYRGAQGWRVLAPGNSGDALVSGGAGADPAWQAGAPGSGDMILAADQSVSGVKRFAADRLAVKAGGAFYTLFRTNATADRTATLPNVTGTLLSIDPAASGTGRIPVATSTAGSMDYPQSLSFVADGYLSLGVAGVTNGVLGLRSTGGGDAQLVLGSTAGNQTVTVPGATGTIALQSSTSTTTTHALFATATAGVVAPRAVAAGDLPNLEGLNGTLDIASGGTGQGAAAAAFDALAPVTTAGDLIYRNGSGSVRLAIGAAGQVLAVNSGATAPAWALNPGDVVYAPTPADIAVNSVTDVTIVTRNVTGVAAGDQVVLEADFVILNNSGANRVYVFTADFDALFDVEFSTASMAASATLMHPFRVRAVCSVRAANLAYMTAEAHGQLAAGVAAGGDVTQAATMLQNMSWGSSTSDATGTLTVALFVRSANATATQTLRLVGLTIRKVSPT